MQKMKALRMSEQLPEEVSEGSAFERRHATHKRMDRWIRLQQFVFGLPDDYSYAICTSTRGDGKFRSRTLVKIGWMTWFGAGTGTDRQHALAVALLGSGESLSSNSTLVFWHSFKKNVRSLGRSLRAKATGQGRVVQATTQGEKSDSDMELLVG